MAIYTGKTNMIDKVVVVKDGSTPEEMDYVYVTNAAGKRELVFEQKPPAPDDNTQEDPPKMRKWSANIKGDVIGGRLFWGNLVQKQIKSIAPRLRQQGANILTTNVEVYSSHLYQVSPYLSLKADGKGGYTFSTGTGIRGNGWAKLDSYPRYPTSSELTDLGVYSPPTGILPTVPVVSQVSGLPLSNVFNKTKDVLWRLTERNDVRRDSLICIRKRYRGQTSITINPTSANGEYRLAISPEGTISGIGPFKTTAVAYLKRTSDVDVIIIDGISSLDGSTKEERYTIRLKKNVVSKEEPPISQLVEVTNITGGIGGNPKAFRMGDAVNFTVDVKGVYV